MSFYCGIFMYLLYFIFFKISFFSVSNVASALFVTVLFLCLFCFGLRNLEKHSFRGIMENVTTIPFCYLDVPSESG